MKHGSQAIALVGALLFASPCTLAREKTDLVTLVNGDRITCEIKSLGRGILKVKTDSMGTLDIEWTDVIEVKSLYYFRIVTANSERHYGSLELSGGSLMLGDDGTPGLSQELVVEITPIEKTWLSRLDGSLSLGANYTKASEVGQLSFDWRNSIQTERTLTDLRATAIVTATESDMGASDVTRKIDLTGAFNKLLWRKMFGTVSAGAHRNDELGFDRRFLLGLSVGTNTIQTNHSKLTFSVGFTRNGEIAQETNEPQVSVEGVLGSAYSFYRYNTPKTDINISLDYYPSLTESGRHRVEFDLTVGREIVKDLTFDVSYFTSYDSDPVDPTGSKNDYAFTVGVGWTY